jgi:hypothetical protein
LPYPEQLIEDFCFRFVPVKAWVAIAAFYQTRVISANFHHFIIDAALVKQNRVEDAGDGVILSNHGNLA